MRISFLRKYTKLILARKLAGLSVVLCLAQTPGIAVVNTGLAQIRDK